MTLSVAIVFIQSLIFFLDIDPIVIFAGRHYVRRLSTDGQYYDLLAQDFDNLVSIDMHIKKERLYLTDVESKKMISISTNGKYWFNGGWSIMCTRYYSVVIVTELQEKLGR